jgi:hypothetical protein
MIQIILPPQKMGGVYDFACELREAIGQDAVRLVHLSEAIVSEWEIGRGDVVVLQMSGYGFAKRGAPFWLLRELEQRRNRIRSLAVFFHELYAIGPPWTSSFWLSPFQRHVARRLAELSDFWMTNREGSALWLRRFAADKPHAVLPVFSNVGEAGAPTGARAPRIIVFGSAGLRQKTYLAAGEKLFSWAKQASLEIHDIGSPIVDAALSATLHSSGVIQHGLLDGNEVDLLMRDALYGVVAYPVEYAAKSGVFAAYAAHGICPLLISENYGQADGLVAGRHYQPGVPSAEDHLKATSIGGAAWDWYQPHRVGRHSDVFKEFLAQLGAK